MPDSEEIARLVKKLNHTADLLKREKRSHERTRQMLRQTQKSMHSAREKRDEEVFREVSKRLNKSKVSAARIDTRAVKEMKLWRKKAMQAAAMLEQCLELKGETQ